MDLKQKIIEELHRERVVLENRCADLIEENARWREAESQAVADCLKRIDELEGALRHIKQVMDTQVAESRRGVLHVYSMSPGGYAGVQRTLAGVLPAEEEEEK